ncbi:MAG TPA: hypothetical protein VHL09_02700 [Dehalococcoidia bacterium]|nr:hypothetical protein [Dehalococcoidia bacterium]
MATLSALQLTGRSEVGRSLAIRPAVAVVLVGLLLALFGALAGLAPTLSAWTHQFAPAVEQSRLPVPVPAATTPSPTDSAGAVTTTENSATVAVVYLPMAQSGARAVPVQRPKPEAPVRNSQDPKQNIPILPALAVPLPVSPAEPPRIRDVANAQIARRIAAEVDRPPTNFLLSDLYRTPVPHTGAGSAGQTADPAAPIRAGPTGVFLTVSA